MKRNLTPAEQVERADLIQSTGGALAEWPRIGPSPREKELEAALAAAEARADALLKEKHALLHTTSPDGVQVLTVAGMEALTRADEVTAKCEALIRERDALRSALAHEISERDRLSLENSELRTALAQAREAAPKNAETRK